MPETKSTSSRVLVPFLFLLLAVAFAVAAFMALTGWQLDRLPAAGAWPDAARPLWSNLADIAQAVLGIPTALAGSIVALVLADRAYRTSQRQVHYETLQYIEQTVTASARDFWHLAVQLRRVEEAGARLHAALLKMLALENRAFPTGSPYMPGTDMSHHPEILRLWDIESEPPAGLEPELATAVVEHKGVLFDTHEAFATSLRALAEQLLTLLQNPISRAVWEKGTRDNDGVPTPPTIGLCADRPEAAKFAKTSTDKTGADFERREIVGVAQLLRLYAETMTPRDQLYGLQLYDLELKARDRLWDKVSGHWAEPDKAPEQRMGPRFGRPLKTADLIQATTSVSALRRSSGTFWTASDAGRLAILGAMIGWQYDTNHDQASNGPALLFTGETILATIEAAYPTQAAFADAVREQLDDSRIHAKDTVDAATRTAHRLGVEGYISPWLIRATEARNTQRQNALATWAADAPIRPIQMPTRDRVVAS